MLQDKDVLHYGIKKIMELETLFLTKLHFYDQAVTGKTKKLVSRLIDQETKHLDKLKELLTLIARNS